MNKYQYYSDEVINWVTDGDAHEVILCLKIEIPFLSQRFNHFSTLLKPDQCARVQKNFVLLN